MSRRESFALSMGLCAGVLLHPRSAHAKQHTQSAHFITKKSPQHGLKVLTAYSETCEEGCRYYKKDLVKRLKLSQHATDSSWYTWSYISSPFKEVRYFNQIQVSREKGGVIIVRSRQLDDRDKDLIDYLEKQTGFRHSPAFDRGISITRLIPQQDGTTRIERSLTLQSSGVLALWPDTIEKNMRNDLNSTFANIDA